MLADVSGMQAQGACVGSHRIATNAADLYCGHCCQLFFYKSDPCSDMSWISLGRVRSNQAMLGL